MAPQVRLELTTLRLTAECSAIELLRNILPELFLPERLLIYHTLPTPRPAFIAASRLAFRVNIQTECREYTLHSVFRSIPAATYLPGGSPLKYCQR